MCESVDAVVSFLEEKIRALNFGLPKQLEATATRIHATDVIDGRAPPDSSGSEQSSECSESESDSSDSPKRRNKAKNAKYKKTRCFKCPEKNHPFFRCPVMIKASLSERLKIVDELHICVRCLSSINHTASDCPNKIMRCYVSECQVKRKHPLLHGHSNDEIKKLTTIGLTRTMNMQSERSHYQIVPGIVRGKNGKEIPITIMLDSGAGMSLATKSLITRANYAIKETSSISMKWTADVTITDDEAKKFDLIFVPQGSKREIVIRDVMAIKDEHLSLPLQGQNGSIFKEKHPHLESVPIPSYNLQRPQVLIGLSHPQLLAQHKLITDEKNPSIVASKSALGWSIYGRYYRHELTNDQEIATNILHEDHDHTIQSEHYQNYCFIGHHKISKKEKIIQESSSAKRRRKK
jgi:hypothetical protein